MSTIIRRALFLDVSPLLTLGMSRQLTLEDMPKLPPEMEPAHQYEMLEAAWAKQANAKPNLFAGLKAVYGGSIARAGLYQLIVVFTSAALPLFTFFLVVFVEQQSLPVGSSGASFEVDRQTAGICAIAMIATTILNVAARTRVSVNMGLLKLRIVNAINQSVFSKALRVSLEQREAFSVGSIVSYMQTDMEIVANAIDQQGDTGLHDLWSAALELAFVVVQLNYFMPGGFAFLALGSLLLV